MQFLAWQNLVFELPIVGAFLMLLLQTVAGGGDHSVGHHEVSVDHGLDHSVSHEGSHDHEHDHGGHGGDEANPFVKAMTFVGLGRVPITILLTTFCLIWGFTGWAANQIMHSVLHYPIVYFWASFAIAWMCAIFATRYIALGISRIMPTTESQSVNKMDLVGACGVVVIAVDTQFGRVQLRDKFGNLHEVTCLVASGKADLPIGAKVIMVDYDQRADAFTVRPNPLAEANLLEQLPRHSS